MDESWMKAFRASVLGEGVDGVKIMGGCLDMAEEVRPAVPLEG